MEDVGGGGDLQPAVLPYGHESACEDVVVAVVAEGEESLGQADGAASTGAASDDICEYEVADVVVVGGETNLQPVCAPLVSGEVVHANLKDAFGPELAIAEDVLVFVWVEYAPGVELDFVGALQLAVYEEAEALAGGEMPFADELAGEIVGYVVVVLVLRVALLGVDSGIEVLVLSGDTGTETANLHLDTGEGHEVVGVVQAVVHWMVVQIVVIVERGSASGKGPVGCETYGEVAGLGATGGEEVDLV